MFSFFPISVILFRHYFDPYIPKIPGMENFSGTVIHSHSYRKPEDFSGKSVLILGAAASGIDIALDLVNHVTRIYLSHNNERYLFVIISERRLSSNNRLQLR